MYGLYNVKGRRPIPMVRGKKIHPGCCEDSYFPKGKFKLFNSLFHSVYIAVMYQEFVVCNVRSAKGFMGYDNCFFNTFDFYCRFVYRALSAGRYEDKGWVVTNCAANILVVSLVLFTWLVYVRTYCVSIATLNQNKRSRFLYLVWATPK